MKVHFVKPSLRAAFGWLLTAPAAYFIIISLLKYVFGAPALYEAMEPTLERWGIREALGWNVNLLILFGPLVALLINLSGVMQVNWHAGPDEIIIDLHFKKLVTNWLVIVLSCMCLFTLFVYLLGENFRN